MPHFKKELCVNIWNHKNILGHYQQYLTMPRVHVSLYDMRIEQFNVQGYKQDLPPFLGEQCRTPAAARTSCWFNKHTWSTFSIMIFPKWLRSCASVFTLRHLRTQGVKYSPHAPTDPQGLHQALVTLLVFSSFERWCCWARWQQWWIILKDYNCRFLLFIFI